MSTPLAMLVQEWRCCMQILVGEKVNTKGLSEILVEYDYGDGGVGVG